MNIIGRTKYLRRLKNYAMDDPENKAFFGVKGLGKSAIIDTVFSKKNCIEFAEEYHYLYVKAILNPGKKGEDLVNFLLDKVINAIDLIDDEELREDLQSRIKSDTEKYHSKESVLLEALQNLRDNEYSVIMIMDEFHNMGRNTEVGSEQYDFLRSLNESGLVYYWIISDSDFSDVYATEQFTTSFFAQKFLPETMPQMQKEDMFELITTVANKYDIGLGENQDIVYAVIGGIPGFVAPAVKCIETLPSSGYGVDELIDALIEYPKSQSLLTVWSRSLTIEQKDLLVELAQREIIYQSEYQSRGIIGKINQLGDNSGLGLVIHGEDENGIFWKINSLLYQEFIVRRRELFDAAEIKTSEKNESVESKTTYIQNNYYTVNNNFFDPDSALDALVGLKQLMNRDVTLGLPDKTVVVDAIQKLPFQQDGWESLDELQREEKADEYADRIFESSDFRADSLTETQMSRFYLTQSILDNLTENCRNNLISAIQVYDLLQFCMDKFELKLFNSESARGILFVKVYESILKEVLKPALETVDESAEKEIRVNGRNYMLKDAPVNEMTINNFSFVLGQGDVQNKLAVLCSFDLGNDECDCQWWRNHTYEMKRIGFLRNDCCHSGDCFTAEKLEELIKRLFKDGAIAKVELYNDIANRIR